MILNPRTPSDATPQVKVESGNRNVALTFWQMKGARVDRDALADMLAALPREKSWRAYAAQRRGDSSDYSSGCNLGNCHVQITIRSTGCTAAEFDDVFAEFEREVMMVVNR